MTDFKSDFPIFQTHPDLVYLDSTSTTQKPSYVIDGVADYLRTGYANIHRGSYELSEISEKLYEDSKKIVAKHIGAEDWREIVYTSNSTYALNMLAQSIWRTGLLKSWDTVLVSIVEHHANIVPWLILKEDYGINVEFIGVTENFDLDYNNFRDKLTNKVKIVALTHVSNTIGQIFDISNVASLLSVRYGKDKPILIIDGSQSIPHFSVNVQTLWCDALFFTGHKVFADSGIWVLWAREELLKALKPIFSWGGAIGEVSKVWFTHSALLPDKFEPGTPNLIWAVSLLKAFEYLESIWWYEVVEAREKELTAYALEKFKNISALKLIWSTSIENRLWVFTFVVEGIHSFDISDYLAEHDICIRAGQHCTEPLMRELWYTHTCRMSLYLYNTRQDIDTFFDILQKAIIELS